MQLNLKAADLAYWNETKQAFQVEPENIRLSAGSSSADLHLSTTVQVR